MSYWSAIGQAVGDWPFQDSASSTVILGGAGGDAALIGGKTTAQASDAGPNGWLPGSLRLDGLNDYVSIPQLQFSGEFTLACWAQSDGVDYDFLWGVDSPGGVNKIGFAPGATDVFVRIKASSLSTAVTHGVTRSAWNHYAIRRNGNDTIDLVVNGVIAAADIFSGPLSGQSKWDLLGSDNFPDQRLSGRLAGVSAYAVALSDEELSELTLGPEPTAVTAPDLGGDARLGGVMTLTPATWQGHGNGGVNATHVLQASDDGLGGWADYAPSVDLSEIATPLALSGKWVRLASQATNAGGPSEPAYSDAVQVASVWPATFEPGLVVVAGATAGRLATSGAATGLVVPGNKEPL